MASERAPKIKKTEKGGKKEAKGTKKKRAPVLDAPVNEKKVERILKFVRQFDMDLELDDLKGAIRRTLPKCEKVRFDIYFKSAMCGVKGKGVYGENLHFFNMDSEDGPLAFRLLVACGAARILAS